MTTVREKILLAAAVGVRWSRELAIRPDALTMIAWRMFPESFGLGRFAAQSANHNAVCAKLSGVDGLLARQWMRHRDLGLYVVTRKGLALAATLKNVHADRLAFAPEDALSDEPAPKGPPEPDVPDHELLPAAPPPVVEHAPPRVKPAPVAERAPPRVKPAPVAEHAPPRVKPPPRAPRRAPPLPPPMQPAPLVGPDLDRATVMVRAYDLPAFLRGRPVDVERVRAVWDLTDGPDPKNDDRMRAIGAFVERIAASSHLRAADRGLFRSLHNMMMRRSAAWLAARGVTNVPAR